MNRHPANHGKVMLTAWVETALRDCVRTRARFDDMSVSAWVASVLMRELSRTAVEHVGLQIPALEGESEMCVRELAPSPVGASPHCCGCVAEHEPSCPEVL